MIKTKKNKSHTKFFNPIRQSWILIALIVVVFPMAWLIIDGLGWFTKMGIIGFIDQEPSAWTNAFLSYFASAFATTAGYFAVLITIYKQEKSRHEDNRKEVLPLVEVSISKTNFADKSDIANVVTNRPLSEVDLNPSNGSLFDLKNVGMREMYDVVLTDITCDLLDNQLQEIKVSPIIYKDRSLTIRLQPVFVGNITAYKTIKINKKEFECNTKIPTTFTAAFSYKDCYGNLYKQKIRIEVSIIANPLEDEGAKSIAYDTTTIKNVEILNAPELIAEGINKNE